MEHFSGEGRIIVQGLPDSTAWSNLPLCQVYVPLVHEWMWYLTQPTAISHNLDPGEPIVVTGPAGVGNKQAQVVTPLEEKETVALKSGSESRFRQTVFPGNYVATVTTTDGPGQRIPFEVRRDPEESRLTPLSAAQIASVSQSGGLRFLSDGLTLPEGVKNPVRYQPYCELPAGLSGCPVSGRTYRDLLADKAAICMLTGQTETLQSFSFDGPLAAWQGIVLGCVLAALGFWALFGAGRNTRRKLGSVLFALRVIAIVVLVWLLLGPVRATTTRHFTPKSLAVVTDVSQSMNVVDPPDKLLDLRWETQSAAGSSVDLLSTCDRAVSAAALHDQLGRLLQKGDRTSDNQRTRSSLQTAGRAVAAAVRLAETCSRQLEEQQATLGPELVVARQGGPGRTH